MLKEKVKIIRENLKSNDIHPTQIPGNIKISIRSIIQGSVDFQIRQQNHHRLKANPCSTLVYRDLRQKDVVSPGIEPIGRQLL